MRTCSDCNEEKDDASCFERMPTGRYRNQCKKCKSFLRADSANEYPYTGLPCEVSSKAFALPEKPISFSHERKCACFETR